MRGRNFTYRPVQNSGATIEALPEVSLPAQRAGLLKNLKETFASVLLRIAIPLHAKEWAS